MQELAAEKAKANGAESKLKEQILSRDQEINALQARMQASYKDHVDEIQQLQGKVNVEMQRSQNTKTWLITRGGAQSGVQER